MTDLMAAVRDGTVLAAERRGTRGGVPVVLLHAAVADRRMWDGVVGLLEQDGVDLLAYDRRGFGASPPVGEAAFTHLDDLLDVLDAARLGRVVLVGSSMGGALAIDAALTAPDRVAGLLPVGSGASGMTDEGEAISWQPDPATGGLLRALEAAEQAGEVAEQVRIERHLWLDGPDQLEGRVQGPVRELFADMDRLALAGGGPAAGDAGLDAWHRLGEVEAPGLAVWGALDLPPDLPFLALTADRLPHVEGRRLPGVAHLPSLEDPALVAALVRETAALAMGGP